MTQFKTWKEFHREYPQYSRLVYNDAIKLVQEKDGLGDFSFDAYLKRIEAQRNLNSKNTELSNILDNLPRSSLKLTKREIREMAKNIKASF